MLPLRTFQILRVPCAAGLRAASIRAVLHADQLAGDLRRGATGCGAGKLHHPVLRAASGFFGCVCRAVCPATFAVRPVLSAQALGVRSRGAAFDRARLPVVRAAQPPGVDRVGTAKGRAHLLLLLLSSPPLRRRWRRRMLLLHRKVSVKRLEARRDLCLHHIQHQCPHLTRC